MNPVSYKQLFEFGKNLLSQTNVSKSLTIAMDMVIELSRAERGLVILFNDRDDEIRFQTARKLKKQDIENPEFEVSRTIIDKVKKEGDPVCLQNALDDKALKQSKSIASLNVLSVICIPLIQNQQVFGVVYLDNRRVSGLFGEETFSLIREFTNFISLAVFSALERTNLQNKISDLEKELRGRYRFETIVGHHPRMLEILQMVSQVADTPATVLIQGESGTGKELIARALHHNSSRRDKPFIAVNCAALPEQLLESELFGHVKGAFTGAIKDRPGWFEKADTGTIFLDEINDMSSALQGELLRILQCGEYSRIGCSEIQQCDVRVITASSKNIKRLISEGVFREELYYRLNVIEIWLPPLRERKSDIPLLLNHFLKRFAKEYDKPRLRFSASAEAALLNYDFPGNIRELENMVQRAVILTNGEVIESHNLPITPVIQQAHPEDKQNPPSLAELKRRETDRTEKEAVLNYLHLSSGHITKAAKLAGVDVSNFHKLIKKHNIDSNTYKKK